MIPRVLRGRVTLSDRARNQDRRAKSNLHATHRSSNSFPEPGLIKRCAASRGYEGRREVTILRYQTSYWFAVLTRRSGGYSGDLQLQRSDTALRGIVQSSAVTRKARPTFIHDEGSPSVPLHIPSPSQQHSPWTFFPIDAVSLRAFTTLRTFEVARLGSECTLYRYQDIAGPPHSQRPRSSTSVLDPRAAFLNSHTFLLRTPFSAPRNTTRRSTDSIRPEKTIKDLQTLRPRSLPKQPCVGVSRCLRRPAHSPPISQFY